MCVRFAAAFARRSLTPEPALQSSEPMTWLADAEPHLAGAGRPLPVTTPQGGCMAVEPEPPWPWPVVERALSITGGRYCGLDPP